MPPYAEITPAHRALASSTSGTIRIDLATGAVEVIEPLPSPERRALEASRRMNDNAPGA